MRRVPRFVINGLAAAALLAAAPAALPGDWGWTLTGVQTISVKGAADGSQAHTLADWGWNKNLAPATSRAVAIQTVTAAKDWGWN